MNQIRKTIDTELNEIKMTDAMKSQIKKNAVRNSMHPVLKMAACLVMVLFLGTGTVMAVEYFSNIHVNDNQLPSLDALHLVTMKEQNPMKGEAVMNYDALQEQLGISLLNSELHKDHDFMVSSWQTDNKDYLLLSIQNYITGDTSNYRKATGEPTFQFQYQGEPYTYDAGNEYYKSISLNVFCALSESQLATGYNMDYLGEFEFVEHYTSNKGYAVNLIEDTSTIGVPSQKIAIFVADGIHYELSGNVSWDIMKEIVDSME